jgi:4'-phosphopantetheinyl transferase EntD
VIRELFPEAVVTVELEASRCAGALLPEEEAQIRGVGEKRRREFRAGRLCARAALARLGIEGHALVSDEQRVPRWPPGVVGSLSHSGAWCGVAVARRETAVGLGLDVEIGGPLGARLASRVCTADEIARFAALPILEGADWPKLCFSAKEAVYKSYYPLTRHALGFRDVELEFDPAGQRFVATLIRSDAPSAAGRRSFPGRFAVGAGRVCTGVCLV